MAKSIKELADILTERHDEAKRIELSILMNICPKCDNKLQRKSGFFNDTIKCNCGFIEKRSNIGTSHCG